MSGSIDCSSVLQSGILATAAVPALYQHNETLPVCYSQRATAECISSKAILECGGSWCEKSYNESNGNWHDCPFGSGSVANIGKVGTFQDQESCRLVLGKIVEQCDGLHGGTWTEHKHFMNVNLCVW